MSLPNFTSPEKALVSGEKADKKPVKMLMTNHH
jgi:hypothetical protein